MAELVLCGSVSMGGRGGGLTRFMHSAVVLANKATVL